MMVTLREVPADAEITSHQLLLRGGFIRRVTSGIYAYLPLMWRVLKKITGIVQEELDSIGALETLLPQLQPAEIWEKSGRWQGYTEGEGIMFNLQDRQNKKLGLGPTHEEVITTLASDLIKSYKQLPITLYQSQTKFRDEIRPRFGLMRSREFIMKDAYSFHANKSCLEKTYKSMDNAYKNIFSKCGIEVLPVEADSGAIGGVASQEFMVTAKAGEDLILTSQDGEYAANQEKAISIPPSAKDIKIADEAVLEEPLQGTLNSICNKYQLQYDQVVITRIFIATIEGNICQPLLISIRGDQELNETKIINQLNLILKKQVLEFLPITREMLKSEGLNTLPLEGLGPDLNNEVLAKSKTWNKEFFRLIDNTVFDLNSFLCGANKENQYRLTKHRDQIVRASIRADLRNARAGDHCVHNKSKKLEEIRGIEVGHIFQLGTKYSLALDASFTNEKGILEPFWMGCYGIGISRLAQAAVEQRHDENGIIWPISIAPFEVIVVIANTLDSTQKKLGERIYKDLQSLGIDVLLDDRQERAGVKFKDADLIGIPIRLVVGRDASEGKIELVLRSNKQSKIINHQEAIKEIISIIKDAKSTSSA